MNDDPLSVLVLDDNPTTTIGSIHQLLAADESQDPNRFTIAKLTNPQGLDAYLDEHEPAVVVVDVDFELTDAGITCLTAFRTLIRRGDLFCVGLSTTDYGRALFPFAACQLLPPSEHQLVGWAYKDEEKARGYHQLIHILDLIRDGKRLPAPDRMPGLAKCRSSEPGAGDFMRRILKGTGDVKMWRYMATAHYGAEDLADLASISESSVYSYLDRYRDAISDFQAAMKDDVFHPSLGQAALHRSTGGSDRHRIVEAFAQTHRRFFQADELEQIVKENRIGRRVSGAWMTSSPLKMIGRARRKRP